MVPNYFTEGWATQTLFCDAHSLGFRRVFSRCVALPSSEVISHSISNEEGVSNLGQMGN